MMSTLERLAYMANQIARNLEAQGHAHAIAATADHIASFWDPRMKAQILAHFASGGEGLGPIAREAIAMLAQGGAPAPQSHATEFNEVGETGHSDAG